MQPPPYCPPTLLSDCCESSGAPSAFDTQRNDFAMTRLLSAYTAPPPPLHARLLSNNDDDRYATDSSCKTSAPPLLLAELATKVLFTIATIECSLTVNAPPN